MKANELRIGNWVFDNKQIQITSEQIKLADEGLYKLLPIPLTEEWLLKFDVLFGFNYWSNQYEIEYGLDGFDLRLPYDVGMSKFIGSIKYVHQLQNLYFALTEKELTVR